MSQFHAAADAERPQAAGWLVRAAAPAAAEEQGMAAPLVQVLSVEKSNGRVSKAIDELSS